MDGALASHLHQGYTTQLSGNCGDTLAPITPRGREIVELSLRPSQLVARWETFGEYLDAVAEQSLGPNVAFLVGHGTVRAAIVGTEARPPTPEELAAMVAEVEAAIEAGATGLSSGLIYSPGVHAAPDEVDTLVATAARRGGLYATHMRNEADGLFASLDESVAAVRAAGAGARLQVSHLKCGSRAVWGRAGEAVARLEAARADGLDVAADQYPYTAAGTTLASILPPALQALGVDACVAALADPDVRNLIRVEIARGISGWENVAVDPGWNGLRISFSASFPEWAGRSLADLADELHRDPADLAFDALVADRLDVSVVIDCMDEADVETIMAVPWIAVCTDAEGRRPGHPILDVGRPHPRTYGSTARVLGHYVRERGILSARDGRRQAQWRPGGAARPARPWRRARGRLRGPGRVRSGDRGRRGDVHRARALSDGHRPCRGQRPAGDRRRRRDRRAAGSPAPAVVTAQRSASPAAATETPAVVRLPGGSLPYTLRRSPRSRGLRVVIHPDRGVVVTVPSAGRRGWSDPERHVHDFLADRESWLRRHLARQAADRAELAARGGLRDGAAIRFRGELHRLRLVPARAGLRRSTVERIGGTAEDEIIVHVAPADRRSIAAVLEAWLKPRARTAIEREIGRHAADLRVTPTAVSIRDQRTRWGSASKQGRLAFSWRLILAPPEALETVVIHELAHLRVFGHGPRFWGLVASRRPDHKTWRRWLHDHATELHAALDEGTDSR